MSALLQPKRVVRQSTPCPIMENTLSVPRPVRKYRSSRSRRRRRPAKRNTLPIFSPTRVPQTLPLRPRSNTVPTRNTMTKSCGTPKKRRLRTFYSKSLGINHLYGKFPINPIQASPTNHYLSGMNAFHAQLAQRTAFEDLTDTDMESLRSPSPTPFIDHRHCHLHHVSDGAVLNYDSAVSNMAANNTDYEGYHDEEENHTARTRTNPLKIIVSAPQSHEEDERQRELHQQCIKRMRRRYMPSDTDDDLTENFSSSEDDLTEVDDTEDEDGNATFGSQLFLSGNSPNYGVYSTFAYSDASDTDYLSAQSGDFDELTVCYQNEKNIPFRNKAMMMNRAQYFSDLGPSDIGSSDTDYLSDSIPPPLN